MVMVDQPAAADAEDVDVDTTEEGRRQRVCGHSMTGKNTTNLKRHLESKHAEIWQKVRDEWSCRYSKDN